MTPLQSATANAAKKIRTLSASLRPADRDAAKKALQALPALDPCPRIRRTYLADAGRLHALTASQLAMLADDYEALVTSPGPENDRAQDAPVGVLASRSA